jgi:hypothetical protein
MPNTLLNSKDRREDRFFHVSPVEQHSQLSFTNLNNISSSKRKEHKIYKMMKDTRKRILT